MKVLLIVVQGKPEGKVIPLSGPIFKIGRGESCHLRPNSEQVSREHTEFSITGDQVVVRDLGSRNGTLVNNKALSGPCSLKDRDLIQVGPLTFAISIEGIPAPAARATRPAPTKAASPDDISGDDIESWLIADSASPTPDRPSGVYGGETRTIATYEGETAPKPKPDDTPEPDEPTPTSEESDVVFDKLNDEDEGGNEAIDEEDSSEGSPEEFIDESNPFYVKKKPSETPKAAAKDSSDAASDILRKLMERRRSSR